MPVHGSAHRFKHRRGTLQFPGALSVREPQLLDEQRQIDAIIPGSFDSASARGMQQTIFRTS